MGAQIREPPIYNIVWFVVIYLNINYCSFAGYAVA